MADIKKNVTDVKDKAKSWTEKHPKITKALKVVGLISLGAATVVVGDKVVGSITNRDDGYEDDSEAVDLIGGGDDSE